MKHFILILLFAAFTKANSQDLIPFNDGKLWGYQDSLGNTRISCQYQYAGRFRFGMAVIGRLGLHGAIDSNNRLIIPVKYEYLAVLDSTEFLYGYNAKYLGEYTKGVMSIYEETKIPPQYSNILKQYGMYTVVKRADSVLGKSGLYVTRSTRSFYGLLDNNGNEVIPCNYMNLEWRNDSLIVLTKQENEEWKQALFNARGEQLLPFDYSVIGKFFEGMAKIRMGDKYGFLGSSGKLVIPAIFDFCENFSGGYAIVRVKDKVGAIDTQGKFVIEAVFSYDEVKEQLKEKYGVDGSAPLF